MNFLNGQERTVGQTVRLFRKAGWRVERIHQLDGPVSAIERPDRPSPFYQVLLQHYDTHHYLHCCLAAASEFQQLDVAEPAGFRRPITTSLRSTQYRSGLSISVPQISRISLLRRLAPMASCCQHCQLFAHLAFRLPPSFLRSMPRFFLFFRFLSGSRRRICSVH